MDSTANSHEILFSACKKGDLTEVKRAIALGANLRKGNDTDLTALMIVANGGYIDIVQYLIFKGVDIDQKNEGNGSALMLAVLNNHQDVVFLLVKSGANVNIPNKSGNTPLFAAAYNGNHYLVSLLIMHGANVNLCNTHGTTPIMEAANRRHIYVVDVLLEHGANIYHKNYNEESALKLAAVNPINHEIIFRLLSVMSSDEYHLIKQQESAKKLTVNDPQNTSKKKRRSRSEDFFRAMSIGLSKMTFGLINPISLQEVKDNHSQAKKSCYFELYHKEVLSYQREIFGILGTLTHLKQGEKSFLDLPIDLMTLILSKHYPDWYHYRLKRDILFIKDKITQTLERRAQPDDNANVVACASLTFQFSQMKLASCREENEILFCEEKYSRSEKSENKIS